jgi:hypothetical protein
MAKIVGGEEWQEKVYNREEWKQLLRMAGNRCILHMAMELINHTYHTYNCLPEDEPKKTPQKLNYWFRKGAFCWFIPYNYSPIHGTKNIKFSFNLILFPRTHRAAYITMSCSSDNCCIQSIFYALPDNSNSRLHI